MTDHIVSYLQDHLDDYLAELEPLVNQDSGSYDKAGVDIVTARLQERFERMGFTVERAAQERFGDDLIARRQGKGGANIMLLGPTGCGKTSATRQVALRHGWGLEEVAGSHSFADADIVALRTATRPDDGSFLTRYLTRLQKV